MRGVERVGHGLTGDAGGARDIGDGSHALIIPACRAYRKDAAVSARTDDTAGTLTQT
ncbi:hypothetical protein Lfu02_77950 [Longispora fulva]|nr:hypothetical protein Lfu02_77950 [Longispora fulva]